MKALTALSAYQEVIASQLAAKTGLTLEVAGTMVKIHPLRVVMAKAPGPTDDTRRIAGILTYTFEFAGNNVDVDVPKSL